jgi:hypothetical protein
MQYLFSVIDDGNGPATPEEYAAVRVFNERLLSGSHWVFAGGLEEPDSATTIDNRRDTPMITDGPFVESKEYLGGLWIIEASDLDAALRLATDASKACNRKIEVRPFQ